MSDHTSVGTQDERMPMRTRVVAIAVVAVGLAVAGAAMLRVSGPRIAPSQPAPRAHYSAPCDWCHVRDASVALIEVN